MTRRFRYERSRDAFVGDGTGLGRGWVDFERVEMEVGARAAMALDDPEQAWQALVDNELARRT